MENSCKADSKPHTIREYIKSWNFWKPAIGVMVGGIGGYLYYHFVGCSSGTCPITSHPLPSIIFGGLLGFLITSSPCSKC